MKSSTDIHWNQRAASVKNDIEVNIMDIFQRELEYDLICRYLTKEMTVLEVGCGNGFSTERFRTLVRHVDAFDYAENMIERAKLRVGETNNRFFLDNVLAPEHLNGPYDTVICVRVLINLRNQEEQYLALKNLIPQVKEGGLLILVEGFEEGFTTLSELRKAVALPPIEPAKINFYSPLSDFLPFLESHFIIEDKFHLGAYDYLTRVVYPLVVGAENAKHNSVFSEKCSQLARAYNADCFEGFSRIKGLSLRKRELERS
jgi:SAM-dependent methyltransferase